MIDLVPFVNKTVDFSYQGRRLSFDLSHALFSSNDIDVGTRLLLKEIASDPGVASARSILDAGCGVGVIGIALASARPEARVVLRDRDFLACAFSERNCARNGLPTMRLGIEPPTEASSGLGRAGSEARQPLLVAPGLLGEGDPLGPYEAVVSNLPAKAGPLILARFLAEASGKLLAPGGTLAFVVVNSLADLVPGWAEAAGLPLRRRTTGSGHSVFLLDRPPSAETGTAAPLGGWSWGRAPALAERIAEVEVYVRSSGLRELGGYPMEVAGYQGLPEFDTNSYATDLGIEALSRAASGSLVRDILFVEPGIGLSALWAVACLGVERVHALSRDLLSLLSLGANLRREKPSIEFQLLSSLEPEALPSYGLDAALVFPDLVPRVDPAPFLWSTLSGGLKRGASAVVVTTSAAATAVDKAKPTGFSRRFEKRRKGFAALAYRRE